MMPLLLLFRLTFFGIFNVIFFVMKKLLLFLLLNFTKTETFSLECGILVFPSFHRYQIVLFVHFFFVADQNFIILLLAALMLWLEVSVFTFCENDFFEKLILKHKTKRVCESLCYTNEYFSKWTKDNSNVCLCARPEVQIDHRKLHFKCAETTAK